MSFTTCAHHSHEKHDISSMTFLSYQRLISLESRRYNSQEDSCVIVERPTRMSHKSQPMVTRQRLAVDLWPWWEIRRSNQSDIFRGTSLGITVNSSPYIPCRAFLSQAMVDTSVLREVCGSSVSQEWHCLEENAELYDGEAVRSVTCLGFFMVVTGLPLKQSIGYILQNFFGWFSWQ